MADIDKITVNNTTYNIKDSTARDSISQGMQNSVFTGDLNTLTTTGIRYCGNAATNLPTSGGGGLVVMNAGTAKLQLFVYNSSPIKLYARRYYNSEWLTWQELA